MSRLPLGLGRNLAHALPPSASARTRRSSSSNLENNSNNNNNNNNGQTDDSDGDLASSDSEGDVYEGARGFDRLLHTGMYMHM
jgi:hypothetical protein